MTKIIGYARVSSADQDFDLQVKRLKAAGCAGVFAEKASGKSTNGRHQLDKALRSLQPDDIQSGSIAWRAQSGICCICSTR